MKLPIPNDWDGTSFCRWAVCWPDSVSWLAILDGLISLPSRGRFWDEKTGNIKNTQASFLPVYLANFDLSEVIMACGDSGIADALNAQASAMLAIANSLGSMGGGCGGGGDVSQTSYCYSGGNVNVQQNVTLSDGSNWPIFGTQPIVDLPESGVPEGYTNEADYRDDKCRKATKIVNDWIATLNNMGNVNNWAGVVGAALIVACIVGLIVVPPAVIPLLLFALTANVGISALLIALANEMEEDKENLICILFEGENAQAVISGLSDALDTLVALIPAEGVIAVTLKSIALWLVSSNTLNFLFTAAAKDQYPSADCSGCGGCQTVQEIPGSNGSIIAQTENTVTVDAEQVGGLARYDAAVVWNWDFDLPGPCGEEVNIENIQCTPSPQTGANVAIIYRGWDTDDNSVYSSNTPPTYPLAGVRRFLVSSAVDVEVVFTFSQSV